MFSSWLGRTRGDDDDDTDSSVEGPDVRATSSASATAAMPENPISTPPPAAAETTTTMTTTTNLSHRRRTWTTAFRDTCLKHGTIHASIVRVLEESGGVDAADMPTASTGVYFHQEGSNEKLVQRFQSELEKFADPKRNDVGAKPGEAAPKSSSTISYVIDKAVAVTKYATKFVWQSEIDIAMEQHGIKDSSSDDEEGNEYQALDETEAILNMDLAVECLLFLRDNITRHATTTTTEQESIIPLPGGAATATAVCQGWIGRILEKDNCGQDAIRTLVRQMAPKDLQFLLQALTKCGVVEVVHRRPQQDDLLLLLPGHDSSSSKEIKLATFDLVRQINLIQSRVDALTARREKCAKDALCCRKNKHERQALQHMKLRQKLEEEISLCHGKLHNLEDQRMALENASSNFEILQVSQQTAKTLKKIREQTENADEILSELQDEIDSNNAVQETLAQASGLSAIVVDEDDLLAELEALNLDDAPGGSAPAPNALENPGHEPSFGEKGDETHLPVAPSSEGPLLHAQTGEQEPTILVEG